MDKLLGISKAACPYCGIVLDKFPLAKTRCRECRNPIYSRTRPQDGKKVLLREDEITVLKEQWSEKHFIEEFERLYFGDRLEYESVKEKMLKQNPMYSDYDFKWKILNKRMKSITDLSNMAEIAFIKRGQAELQYIRKDYSFALSLYCNYLYLDLIDQIHMFRTAKQPFSYITRSFINNQVMKILEKLDISISDLEKEFLTSNEPYAGYDPEISPVVAWDIFNGSISGSPITVPIDKPLSTKPPQLPNKNFNSKPYVIKPWRAIIGLLFLLSAFYGLGSLELTFENISIFLVIFGISMFLLMPWV